MVILPRNSRSVRLLRAERCLHSCHSHVTSSISGICPTDRRRGRAHPNDPPGPVDLKTQMSNRCISFKPLAYRRPSSRLGCRAQRVLASSANCREHAGRVRREIRPHLLCGRAGSSRFFATTTPLAFDHGPVPIRLRASIGLLPLSGISLRAQVGVPSLVAESDAARQVLTNLIRSAQPAQVCCLAASASDKEAHGRIGLSAFSAHALGVVTADYAQCCHRREKKSLVLHKKFSFLSIRYFLSGEFLDAYLATSGNLFFQIKITFSKRD